MLYHPLKLIPVVVLTWIYSSVAQATLIGDAVGCDSAAPGLPTVVCPTSTVVVNDGPFAEFILRNTAGTPLFNVDIDADSVTVTSVFIGEIVGLTIATGDIVKIIGLQWVDHPDSEIVGFNLQPFNNPGITDASISFASQEIGINFDGFWFNDSSARIEILTDHAVATVPEPAPLALFAAGLLGVCWKRRRLTDR